MHEHDIDLIAALAEGALAGPAAAAAETRLADCHQCREELAAQRRALDFLRAAPPARLSELEAARLRRRVLAEVGVSSLPSRRSRSAPRAAWGAAVIVAAALVGLVVVGSVSDLLGGGSDVQEAARITEAPASEPMSAEDTAAAGDSTARLETAEDAVLPQPRYLGELGPVTEEDLRSVLADPVFDQAALLTRRHAPRLREMAGDELTTLPCMSQGYAISDRNLALLVGARTSFNEVAAVVLAYASASGRAPDAPLDERILWVLGMADCGILHSQGEAPPG